MKFTKTIKARGINTGRIMDGYEFLGDADYEGKIRSNDLDSFYDGWDGEIMEGEDGKIYLVDRFPFREYEPLTIWCEVKKIYYICTEGIEADKIYGDQYPFCMDADEVKRLSKEWEVDLFKVMHEADEDEIKEYGFGE